MKWAALCMQTVVLTVLSSVGIPATGQEFPSMSDAPSIIDEVRVMQTPLGELIGTRRQRVVDANGPSLLLEGRQDGLLVDGRYAISLNELVAQVEFRQIVIPFRYDLARHSIAAVIVPGQAPTVSWGNSSRQTASHRQPGFRQCKAGSVVERQATLLIESSIGSILCGNLPRVSHEPLADCCEVSCTRGKKDVRRAPPIRAIWEF